MEVFLLFLTPKYLNFLQLTRMQTYFFVQIYIYFFHLSFVILVKFPHPYIKIFNENTMKLK